MIWLILEEAIWLILQKAIKVILTGYNRLIVVSYGEGKARQEQRDAGVRDETHPSIVQLQNNYC